ncbi:MAG: AI-2E family transporter [Oscillospiraceae bacterium]|jgi:predicted PurR-regulated permease PerM|nr:AI-2E family transporter [Oscillospiraceae bacterium]
MKNILKHIHLLFLAIFVLLAYKMLFDFESVARWFGGIISIVSPFLIGFVVAFCINIPVSWLEHKILKIKYKWVKKIARSVSVLVILAIVISVLVLGVSLFIPMVYENVSQLIALMPDYIDQAINAIKRIPLVQTMGIDEQLDVFTQGGVSFEGIFDSFGGGNIDLIGTAGGVGMWLFGSLFTTILTIVSTIYFLLEYNRMRDFFKRLISAMSNEKRQGRALKYVRLIDLSFRKFISCQVLDSIILGTIVTIEFFLIGSSYALVLGIMLGVLNIIPYFGSIFGSIIATLIIMFEQGWEIGVITAIILLITQQIDGNFINPKIMGTSFKISPVLVIIAITIGGAVGGVPGMIFGVPTMNVLKTLLEEYVEKKEKQKNSKPVEIAPASD